MIARHAVAHPKTRHTNSRLFLINLHAHRGHALGTAGTEHELAACVRGGHEGCSAKRDRRQAWRGQRPRPNRHWAAWMQRRLAKIAQARWTGEPAGTPAATLWLRTGGNAVPCSGVGARPEAPESATNSNSAARVRIFQRRSFPLVCEDARTRRYGSNGTQGRWA